MKPVAFWLALLMAPLTLAAQSDAPPPVIESIQPSVGPTEGGTIVSITGSGLTLPPNFACILPCPAMVSFGDGALIPVIEETDARITVRTPAHAAGRVDVTVRTGDGRSATKVDGFTFVEDGERGYRALLLPVHLDAPVPGSGGSLWVSDLWIRNDGEREITLARWTCPPDQACPAIFPLTRILRAGETIRGLPPTQLPPSSNVGRMLYVSEADAGRITASLRVRDISRDELDAGAGIPIVREADLFSGVARLMSIPLDPRFRLLLRIYDTTGDQSRFRVRIFAQEEGVDEDPVPLRELDLIASAEEPAPFRLRPAYAQYSGLASLLDSANPPERIRIEIEPRTAGSLFWAFVSITNDQTQRLTLVTP